jgi:ATP-binding cassette, subfamily B, bacterial PglK
MADANSFGNAQRGVMSVRPGTSSPNHIALIISRTPVKVRLRIIGLGAFAAVAEITTLSALLLVLTEIGQTSRGTIPIVPLSSDPANRTTVLLSGLVILIALSASVRLLAYRETIRWAFRYAANLAIETHRRVLEQGYSYHTQHSSADLVAANERIHATVYTVALSFSQTIVSSVVGAGVFVFLLVISPREAVAGILLIALMYGVITLVVRHQLRTASTITNITFEERVKLLQETVIGIRDILLGGREEAIIANLSAIENRFAWARGNVAYVSHFPRVLAETALLLLVATAALVIVRSGLNSQGSLTAVAALAVGGVRLVPIAHQWYQNWALYRSSRPAMDEVEALLTLPRTTRVPAQPETRITEKCGLSFCEVTYRHSGRTAPALKDITFQVPPGTKLAIVGPSGSGKTTLLDLAMGLLAPQSGQITLTAGLSDVPIDRRTQGLFAHVSQRVFLSDTTIAGNIALDDNDINHGRLLAAAETAQARSFVESLPEGFETLIGEGGIRLSGGQRQRIGIARALYQNKPILILDEGTSFIDHRTARDILSGIACLSKDRWLTIFTTHSRSDLAHADLILELIEGEITFFGPQHEYGTFAAA